MESHPEMVLKLEHFASFHANWRPKGDNIREIAQELKIGLDACVFIDDNPAEIENVRQFVPEVETILLGPDPAHFVEDVRDRRLFEPRALTEEDLIRTSHFQDENQRKELLANAGDMPTYLKSLQMTAVISPFLALDVPRIAQLINKSNQFNLTTLRMTEAEVSALVGSTKSRHANS